MRIYSNAELPAYVKSQYHSGQPVRMGIVPFDVPENFAPANSEAARYGHELARKFQLEFRRSGEVAVIELFDRDRWPGKREEYFNGNYGAIEIARNAGYDLVMVGFLEDIKNDEDLVLYTKIIDVTKNVTVWDGRTTVTSRAREENRQMADVFLATERPDLFAFPERAEKLVTCSIDHILTGTPVPY